MASLCKVGNEPPGICSCYILGITLFVVINIDSLYFNPNLKTVYILCYTCIQFLIGDYGFAVIAAFSNLKYIHRITMWNNQK